MIKKILHCMFLVCAIAFCLVAHPLNCNAAEKNSAITLKNKVGEAIFKFEFENEGNYNISVIEPNGETHFFETMEDKAEIPISDPDIGEYKVHIYADDEFDVKVTVSTTAIKYSDGDNENIKITSNIVNLKLRFEDGNIVGTWDDTGLGNVNVEIINPQNMQRLVSTTVSDTKFEESIPENVSEIEVYLVPASSAKIDGAGVRYTMKVVRDVQGTIELSGKNITNELYTTAHLNLEKELTVVIKNGTSEVFNEKISAGEYNIELPLNGINNDFTAYIIDDKSNLNTYTFSVTRDITYPSIKLNEDISDGMIVGTDRYMIKGTATKVTSIDISGIEVPVGDGNRFSYEYPLDNIGNNKIVLTAVDEAGNVTSIEINIVRNEEHGKLNIYPLFILVLLFIVIIVIITKFCFRKKKVKIKSVENDYCEDDNVSEIETSKPDNKKNNVITTMDYDDLEEDTDAIEERNDTESEQHVKVAYDDYDDLEEDSPETDTISQLSSSDADITETVSDEISETKEEYVIPEEDLHDNIHIEERFVDYNEEDMDDLDGTDIKSDNQLKESTKTSALSVNSASDILTEKVKLKENKKMELKEERKRRKLQRKEEKLRRIQKQKNRRKNNKKTDVEIVDVRILEMKEHITKLRKKKLFTNDILGMIFCAILCVSVILFSKYVLAISNIESGSMEPTLMTGDKVIYNRLAYITKDIEHGDIILFEFEMDEKKYHFTKRVIGVAGDKIEFRDGYVFLNGTLVQESYIDESIETNSDKTFEVPDGYIFVMGDNREHSYDSREFENPYIPVESVEGKYLSNISEIFR